MLSVGMHHPSSDSHWNCSGILWIYVHCRTGNMLIFHLQYICTPSTMLDPPTYGPLKFPQSSIFIFSRISFLLLAIYNLQHKLSRSRDLVTFVSQKSFHLPKLYLIQDHQIKTFPFLPTILWYLLQPKTVLFKQRPDLVRSCCSYCSTWSIKAWASKYQLIIAVVASNWRL